MTGSDERKTMLNSRVQFLHPRGLAFGATAIAAPGSRQENADATVAAAWDLGIRYFDTAPMYMGGRSETMLGHALVPYRRADYLLSSKVGRLVRRGEPQLPGESALWRYDFSRDGILRSVDESLERIGCDYLDIAYIHDPDNFFEQAVSESYEALQSLRASGTVRAIGVGITHAPLLMSFLERVELDVVLLAGRYSLIDNEGAEGVLPTCREQGVTVVLAQTLHGGLVDGVNPPDFHYRPIPPHVAQRVQEILGVCNRLGVPIGAAALRFVLSNPDVDMVLTGPANPDQLLTNVAWSHYDVPVALWEELSERELIVPDAPVLR
jgi:D-threo-aldose 1-dehydrogenase